MKTKFTIEFNGKWAAIPVGERDFEKFPMGSNPHSEFATVGEAVADGMAKYGVEVDHYGQPIRLMPSIP